MIAIRDALRARETDLAESRLPGRANERERNRFKGTEKKQLNG